MGLRGSAVFVCAISFCAIAFAAAPNEPLRELLPGDRLEVRCPEVSELCVVTTLSFAGSIQLPGLPTINLAKLTPEQAADRIVAAIAARNLAPDPRVTVRLLPSRRKSVTVFGLVRTPGEIFAESETTLQSALAQAEPQPAADLTHVTVHRVEGGTATIDATGPIWHLRPGDRVEVLAIAPNPQVFVVGGVKTPGAVVFHEGMTVADALRFSGGLDAHGSNGGWRVLHAGDADSSAAGEGTVLRSGDTVEIPLSRQRAFVTVMGGVRKPGSVPLRPGMKLTEALREAGGLASNGDFTRIELRSVVGGRRQVVNLLALLSGKQKDPVLAIGDTIVVPTVRVKDRA